MCLLKLIGEMECLCRLEAAKEILERESINEQPLIKLNCKPKDFYEHAIDDFEFVLPKGIKKLENTLELMT